MQFLLPQTSKSTCSVSQRALTSTPPIFVHVCNYSMWKIVSLLREQWLQCNQTISFPQCYIFKCPPTAVSTQIISKQWEWRQCVYNLGLCLTNHQTMKSFRLGTKTADKETIMFCLPLSLFIVWTYRGQHIENSQSWKVLCCLADESSYWLTLTQKSQMAFGSIFNHHHCFYSSQISVYMFKYSVLVCI